MGGMWLLGFFCLSLTYCVHSQDSVLMTEGVARCYGYVRCYPGYLFTHRQCARIVWKNEEANDRGAEGFPLPHPPFRNWAMCLKAMPTEFTRAFVSFRGGDDFEKVISHFDIRMDNNYGAQFDTSVVINEGAKDENGTYMFEQEDVYYPDPYPFAVGQNFTLKIEAVSEFTLKYFINGVELATRTVNTSITEVSKVIGFGDIFVWYINVWCGC